MSREVCAPVGDVSIAPSRNIRVETSSDKHCAGPPGHIPVDTALRLRAVNQCLFVPRWHYCTQRQPIYLAHYVQLSVTNFNGGHRKPLIGFIVFYMSSQRQSVLLNYYETFLG